MSTAHEDDADLTDSAQAKAKLIAYLNNTPGEHRVMEIAEATGMTPISVGQRLAHMAASRLVRLVKHGTTKYYSGKKNGAAVHHEEEAAPEPVKRRGKAIKTKEPKESPGKGFKLVVNGTLVNVGRDTDGTLMVRLDDA